jgi:flavin-binding protein dodecin
MLDLARARDRMVDVQIAGRGVREPYVLEALRRVPGEAFVEPGFEAFAYEGRLTGHQKRCQIITAARRLALGGIMLGSLGGIISERPGGFIGRHKRRMWKMSDHVYSITEIVGTSKTSVEDAVQHGIKTAAKTLRNLEWFEVTQIRGHIVDGEVGHYQVCMKLGLRYEPK